jgi:DNA modification methylase
MPVTLHEGDCLDVLKSLPDRTVDSVVTDPPYGISFMGKKWDYDIPSVELWQEALRVLKPGGHLLSFCGTRTYHRMVVAIEDAGFDIRDQIGWLYGSGFPKSHNLAGDMDGWGTALKPSHENIVLARRPFVGTVAENVSAYGTGAMNIEARRVEGTPEVTRFNPAKHSHDGWRMDMTGEETAARVNSAGRWPANIIHDGSDEVMEAFAAFGERPSGKWNGHRNTPKTRAIYGTFDLQDESGKLGDTGTAARFFYCAKASKAERDGSKHPTVKPIALMRYLCRLVTPKGGTVLDPFAGSGTTGQAAVEEGFSAILIEREAVYCQDIRHRLALYLGR